MKNVFRTLVVVVFITMAGVIGVGYMNFMHTQKVIKSQKAQILELTQQNVRNSVELQNTKTEIQMIKDRNVLHEDGTFNAVIYDKSGKMHHVMSAKGILGAVKTVIWKDEK